MASGRFQAIPLHWPRQEDTKDQWEDSKVGFLSSMLPTRWQVGGRSGAGSSSSRRELGLPVVGAPFTDTLDLSLMLCSYDPEYQQWDWGKISALQEIDMALQAGYGYYYMGVCRLRLARPSTTNIEQATTSTRASR